MDTTLYDTNDLSVSTLEGVAATVPIDLILWGVLGVVLIVYALHTLVMLWHWKEYSTGKYTTVANMFMYVGVSAGLVFLMVLSAAWYTAV